MRVLGIDPGLTRCGIGIVEGEVGRPLTLVDVDVVRTSADQPVALRLVTIEKGSTPGSTSISPTPSPSSGSSPAQLRTVMGTAQASGIAMVAAARRGLPVALHTPERGQGRGLGQRPRRQGTGRRRW